jgi:hypothetical protein
MTVHLRPESAFTLLRKTHLVAAAIHGGFLEDPMANDELVVAYTEPAIAGLVSVHEEYEEEWQDESV